MKKIIVLLLVVSTTICACSSQPNYENYCDICEDGILPGCTISAFDPFDMCPYCANSIIRELVNGNSGLCTNCGYIYDSNFSGQFGLCEDCTYDLLVPCISCDTYTLDWSQNNPIVLCNRCMGRLIEDQRVEMAIINWFEE